MPPSTSLSPDAPKLRLRVRFGDGSAILLSDLPASMSLASLRDRVATDRGTSSAPEMRLVAAGPPPRPLTADPSTAIGTLLQSGETLMVIDAASPAERAPARASSARISKNTSRGRARGKRASAAAGRARARVFKAAGVGRALGSEVSSGGAGENVNLGGDKGEGDEGAGRKQEALGNALVSMVGGGAQDSFARSFRKGLAEERQERERLAEGQRRYEAFLSKKYNVEYFRFPDEDALVFRVKYQALHERKWRYDPPGEDDEEASYFPTWRRAVLGGVLATLLTPEENGDDHAVVTERLRPIVMARHSPRLFWNLVRFYGNDIERGMKELVPNANWTFLNTRTRKLSEKARRNAEQAAANQR